MGCLFTRHPFFISSKKAEVMIHPIWKNYIVNLGTAQSQEYVICYSKDGSITSIYHGKAWKKPGESSITICINDICADWLVNTFPSLAEGFNRQDMPVEFIVQTISNAGIYTEVARVTFVNDWSYDASHDAERDGLAAPINGHVDARQWLLWTALNVAEVEAEVFFHDGRTMKVFIPVEISADFNEDFNVDFSKSVRSAGSGTAVFSIEWDDVDKIVVNGNEYRVIDSCARYVLYYLNAYGGWDSLLIEGASSEQDNVTRHVMNKEGAFNRQKSNYLNEIQKMMTLHTSWLSDEQSLRMHHLLNSTEVYLHDLSRNEILPVVLENSSTPYKTYKGEGGKLVNYKIEVSIAQSMRRR